MDFASITLHSFWGWIGLLHVESSSPIMAVATGLAANVASDLFVDGWRRRKELQAVVSVPNPRKPPSRAKVLWGGGWLVLFAAVAAACIGALLLPLLAAAEAITWHTLGPLSDSLAGAQAAATLTLYVGGLVLLAHTLVLPRWPVVGAVAGAAVGFAAAQTVAHFTFGLLTGVSWCIGVGTLLGYQLAVVRRRAA